MSEAIRVLIEEGGHRRGRPGQYSKAMYEAIQQLQAEINELKKEINVQKICTQDSNDMIGLMTREINRLTAERQILWDAAREDKENTFGFFEKRYQDLADYDKAREKV